MDKCSSGYFGDFCNRTCPSGRYGPLCGGMCTPKCSVKKCHHVYGCPENHVTTVQTMISGNQDKPIDVTTQYLLSSEITYSSSSEILQLKWNSHTAQQLPITTKYNLRQSEKNPVEFDNHHSFTKNEIQPMYIYLFVGLGVVVVLFMVIMIIELYRKVKFAKEEIVIEQPCNGTRLRRESSNQFNGTPCNTSCRQAKGSRSHPSVDIEYAEINEVVEMQANNNSNATTNGRPGKFPLRHSHNI